MDIDHLRTWIGREERATEILSDRLVRQFCATLDLPADLTGGAQAPLMIHWCLTQNTAAQVTLGADGHPERGAFLPPVTLPRRMWAGGALTFEAPLRIGEVVTRRSRITDVTLKDGRSGPLCFVTVDHAYTVDDRPAVSERQDIVYRGAGAPGGAGPAGQAGSAAPVGAQALPIAPTPHLLFRYSAVTFNAHRIHYDLAYAREVEGYPGLIVHGPLQATLLCRYAAALKGAAPRRFSFRSLSPVFDTSTFTLNAEPDGDALRLWTAQDPGPIAMQAEATW